MARLKLNPNASLKDLGRQVLVAAAGKYSGTQSIRESAEANIVEMCTGDGQTGSSNPNIVFHYDTDTEVHVVIPYVGDKVIRDEQDFAPTFDFDHLAAETMGFIVIFGCGK